MIVDEAHRLKNNKSRLSRELQYIQRQHLLLLSGTLYPSLSPFPTTLTLALGTPVQNNTQELWTILNLLDDSAFPDWPTFEAKYGELKDAKQVAELQKELKPYLV